MREQIQTPHLGYISFRSHSSRSLTHSLLSLLLYSMPRTSRRRSSDYNARQVVPAERRIASSSTLQRFQQQKPLTRKVQSTDGKVSPTVSLSTLCLSFIAAYSKNLCRLRAERKANGTTSISAPTDEARARHRESVAEYYQRCVVSLYPISSVLSSNLFFQQQGDFETEGYTTQAQQQTVCRRIIFSRPL